MRLFGKVDGQINRFDRAMYMTPPFDLVLAPPLIIAGWVSVELPDQSTINQEYVTVLVPDELDPFGVDPDGTILVPGN